jgi:hypothetical protein
MTPTDAIFSIVEPRNAIGHDVEKPKLSVATPVVLTPSKDDI